MKHFLFVVTGMIVLAGSCFAQNETSSFSHSQKSTSQETIPPSGPTLISVNAAETYKHAFALTETQEASLSENSLISLNVSDTERSHFMLADDPAWVPGKTSVKITQLVTNEDGFDKADIKVKWGKGKFSVSMKRATNYSFTPVPLKEIRIEPGHPASTEKFQTNIINSGGTIEVSGFVACDLSQELSYTTKMDGHRTQSQSSSVKTKQLVLEPLPPT